MLKIDAFLGAFIGGTLNLSDTLPSKVIEFTEQILYRCSPIDQCPYWIGKMTNGVTIQKSKFKITIIAIILGYRTIAQNRYFRPGSVKITQNRRFRAKSVKILQNRLFRPKSVKITQSRLFQSNTAKTTKNRLFGQIRSNSPKIEIFDQHQFGVGWGGSITLIREYGKKYSLASKVIK